MYSLSAIQLLTIWEKGLNQASIERGNTILAIAMPMVTQPDLELMTIGVRNRHLLNIREYVFGKQLHCIFTCSQCKEPMEFSCDIEALTVETPDIPHDLSFTIGQRHYQFRLMNCADLRLAGQQADLAQAEQLLIERCIMEINDNGQQPVPISDFSAATIEKLAKQLQHCDPNAALLINTTCPACAENEQTALDIPDFLWHEIAAQSKLLLMEVHQLAQAYGWHETDILNLSNSRRQYYLRQINS